MNRGNRDKYFLVDSREISSEFEWGDLIEANHLIEKLLDEIEQLEEEKKELSNSKKRKEIYSQIQARYSRIKEVVEERDALMKQDLR